MPETLSSPESSEHLSVEERFRRSEKEGQFYSDFIQAATSGESQDIAPPSFLLEKIAKEVPEFFAQQEKRFREKPLDAKQLLEQRTGSLDELPLSAFRLEQPTPGLFVVRISHEVFPKIKKNAQAFAAYVEEGISFIALPEHKDTDQNKRQDQEQIPHETHHLIWNYARREKNLIASDEKDDELRRAFFMFQDELIARMCSEGSLFGYTHLYYLSPEERQKKKSRPTRAASSFDRASSYP